MSLSPRTVMNIKDAVVRLSDTSAGLAVSGVGSIDFQCVVTSAQITTSPNLETIPATGCAPETQAPSASSYALVLAWLQDWSAPAGGLSGYAWANDTKLKWFSIAPNNPAGTVVATGQAYVVAGPYLGDFATTLVSTGVTWPCDSKPTITMPA